MICRPDEFFGKRNCSIFTEEKKNIERRDWAIREYFKRGKGSPECVHKQKGEGVD